MMMMIKCQKSRFTNDLPSNDFNLLFRDLLRMEEEKGEDVEGKSSNLPMCFLMGAPGSYCERLFPKESLHLVHANCTLHWLSQVGATSCVQFRI